MGKTESQNLSCCSLNKGPQTEMQVTNKAGIINEFNR